jgi:hypothetical protein
MAVVFQEVGDKQKLSKGPRSYDRSKFSGGSHQLVGDHVPMSSKPVPLQSGNKHVQGGAYQKIGDSVSLSRSPQKGWNSFSTPMSDRAWKQSDMPGFGSGKKSKGKKGR